MQQTRGTQWMSSVGLIPLLACLVGCQSTQPANDPRLGSLGPLPRSAATTSTQSNGVTWHQNLDQARAQAAREGKLLFILFTGKDWCVWCRRLDEEILSSDAFQQWAEGQLVCVELDYPRRGQQAEWLAAQNKQALADYRSDVTSYPTVLLVNPQGDVLLRKGYEPGGAANWLEQVRRDLAN